MTITRKNPKLGNYLHYLHQSEARDAGEDENGESLYKAEWDESWGAPPSEEDLEAWDEPEPEANPVSVAKAAARQSYLQRRDARQANIDSLMVDVSFAMVASKAFTADNVDDEGSVFMEFHAVPIYAYVMGGNSTARSLYDAIVASRDTFPWLSDAILAIFAAALIG